MLSAMSQYRTDMILFQIVSLVKGSHYQVACGKYFMLTHNSGHDFSPNHPNEYFDESQKVLHGGKDAGSKFGLI